MPYCSARASEGMSRLGVRMRTPCGKAVAVAAVTFVLAVVAVTPGASARRTGPVREYVVLYDDSATLAEARAELKALGATIERENTAIGLATVRSSNASFLTDVMGRRTLFGAARNRAIGHSVPALRPKLDEVESLPGIRDASRRPARGTKPSGAIAEPFAKRQWDMQMIHATDEGSYAVQPGNPGVLIGIIDTGINGKHQDIAPNFSSELSINFTTDIKNVDGPCKQEPDKSCSDPAIVDENSHGTHVAGTVGSPINGLGIAGVAPGVTLVNIRAGQDSGYFFLQASVDALTYAGDNGIDVVNMSFFIDPWLYNCTNNPADTPEQQMEQQTIIAATQQALDYAHSRGVTLIGGMGNEATDLGNPTVDTQSPNYPPDSEHDRTVDNSCLVLPTEGNNVVSVGGVGPSGRKAYYSNYGIEQTSVTAPGGDYYDFPGTNNTESARNMILAPYPLRLARAADEITKRFKSKTPFVKVDCQGKKPNKKNCAVYQYLQGTSMAAPHATGVAALIVSQFGTPDASGLTMDPAAVQARLEESATDTPCPTTNPYVYPDLDPQYTALCEDPADPGIFNGFYGHGIVDALAAVTGP
jgi:lantibiotic leader peptide-processing serine protease